MDQSGNGYIKIRVTTVGGTVPAAGASVKITDKIGGDMLYDLRTNMGGVTPTVMLPAPRETESLTPGAVRPYGIYDIRIIKEGYIPVELTDVPIFDRVTSVQSVDLLPADTENMFPDNVGFGITVDESGDGYLAGGDGGRGRGEADSDSEGGGT